MHELAVCQALMEQIEHIAHEEQADHVVAIFHDQPILGRVPTENVEPQFLVKGL